MSGTYAFAGTPVCHYAHELVATIGGNLKRLRLAAGHRHQGKFASDVGVSQQWLSDVETGRIAVPDAANLMKIAAAIPCTLDELVRGISPEFDKSRRLLRAGGDPERAAQAEAIELAQRIRTLPDRWREHLTSLVELAESMSPSTTQSTAPGAPAPHAAGSRTSRGRRTQAR